MMCGSDDDELPMAWSIGSDDLEAFGMSSSYKEEDEEHSRGNYGYGSSYYEMSSDELSFEDGEDCVDNFGIELEEDEPMSYEDFQSSQRNDDEPMEERSVDCNEEYDEICEEPYHEYEQGWSEGSHCGYSYEESGVDSLDSSCEWRDELNWIDRCAFGLTGDCGCENCRKAIHDLSLVKVNSSQLTELQLCDYYTDDFSDEGWRILSRYIGNNNQLQYLDFSEVNLTDEITALVSPEIQRNRSIASFNFAHSNLGVDGIRALAPVLSTSIEIGILCFNNNPRMKDEGLEIMLTALASSPIRVLCLDACGIAGVTMFDGRLFPRHLELLTLCHNMINSVGCRALAQLLQREDSTLKELNLRYNHIDNEGAGTLANSLRTNKSLKTLHLQGNRITVKGQVAFISLVNDISSIKTTFSSNHTLEIVNFEYDCEFMIDALRINATSACPEQAGRRKVIDTQLNIIRRAALACLQGIQKQSSIFSDIDCPIHLLPEILGLIGENHKLNELFAAVLSSVDSLTTLSISKDEILKSRRNNLSLDMKDIAREIKTLLLADKFSRDDHFRKENLTYEMGIVFQEIIELDREIASLAFAKRWKPPRNATADAESKRRRVDEVQE